MFKSNLDVTGREEKETRVAMFRRLEDLPGVTLFLRRRCFSSSALVREIREDSRGIVED